MSGSYLVHKAILSPAMSSAAHIQTQDSRVLASWTDTGLWDWKSEGASGTEPS